MRLKVLALFLVIQVLSFGIWNTFFNTPEPLAKAAPSANTTPSHAVAEVTEVASDNPAAEKPEIKTAVMPDFSVRNFNNQMALNTSQKEQIARVLRTLPAAHAESVEQIILDYNQKAYRGLGGSNMIILRAVNMDMEEMMSVLVHETGHNVDYGFLSAREEKTKSAFKDGNLPLYLTDPSLIFYQINWESEKSMKKTATNMDFVSGYAMTDCFEDFAETYVYYVLHNKDFKALTTSSEKLYDKYVFMRDFVFNGVEFDTGNDQVNVNNRPWDITLLSYELAEFLN